MSKVQCPNCRNDYESLGCHWSKNPNCDYPDLTARQEEIITGVLMGDGSIIDRKNPNSNPTLKVPNTNREFLEWLRNELGYLARNICLDRTAEEAAELMCKKGPSDVVNEENYNDQYKFSTRRHPGLKSYRDWYGDDGKRFPEDIELTPLVLKLWYVCDGHNHNAGEQKPYIVIRADNEEDRPSMIEHYFDSLQVEPQINSEIRFRRQDSLYLWDYMGEPIPGFEYKWPGDHSSGQSETCSNNVMEHSTLSQQSSQATLADFSF